MSASKYLPPFTTEERTTMAGARPERVPVAPTGPVGDADVTYADFLGDEADGQD